MTSEHEFHSAAVIDALIDESYGAALRSRGFAPARPRHWVRQRVPFAVDLFQVQSLRAAGSPRWGFSLVFGPEVKTGRLKWHRTAKTAVFDVVVDPLDIILPEHASFIFRKFGPLEKLRATLREQAPRVVEEAQQTWARVRDLEQLAVLLGELQRRKTVRFGFHNYVQHPLAYAFTLARLGRRNEALAELQKSHHMSDPELARQLTEALEHAEGTS